MHQLDAHDAAFLYNETGNANANVSLIQIYDQSTAPGGTVRFKTILAHIAARLHLAPRLRQRLLRVPFELDHPYWVEDEHFDLEYHVRHIALPRPGDWRQFCIQASRIHARPLDLHRPLWEIYVIEGLDSLLDLPAGSFALLVKMHHAAIDLEHSDELMELLHDATPEPREAPPAPPWFPERAPGAMALLTRGAARTFTSPFRLARPLVRVARRIAPAAMSLLSDLVDAKHLPVTRFNAIVSPHRVFETRRFAERDFEAIAALVPGATADDVLLAVCGGGLRDYLQLHDELPDDPLHAIVPEGGAGVEADRRGASAPLAWRRAELGCEFADPLERLEAVVAARRADGAQPRRGSASADRTAPGGADDDPASRPGRRRAPPRLEAAALDALERAVPAPTLALAGKVLGRAMHGFARRAPLATCTVASVAGPTLPLYLVGARMTYFSAILPISDGMGLVFAVSRYDGQLIVSPTSCRELMPDPETFARCLRESFQQFAALLAAPKRRGARAEGAARAKVADARPGPAKLRPRASRASAGGKAPQAGPRGGMAPSRPRAGPGGPPRSRERGH